MLFMWLPRTGKPIRWALNALHKTGLVERVCGPETMLRLCAKAADDGIGIYLYGTTPRQPSTF